MAMVVLVFNVIFQQYFSYIVAVGHTDGGKLSFLRNPTDKLYHHYAMSGIRTRNLIGDGPENER